jgi:hypothetical protein
VSYAWSIKLYNTIQQYTTIDADGSYPVRIVRRNDEVGLDVVLPQVGVTITAVALLHLVVVAKVLQGLLGDVNPTKKGKVSFCYDCYFII